MGRAHQFFKLSRVMVFPDFQWEFVILEIGNLSLSYLSLETAFFTGYVLLAFLTPLNRWVWEMGNGKWEIDRVLPHESIRELWEMGNGNLLSLVQAGMDPVGNGKWDWEMAWGHVEPAHEPAPWEMGIGKLLCWKLDAGEPPAFGKRETGN